MFNLAAQASIHPIADDASCLVIDDVLAEPERWQRMAAAHADQFVELPGNAYPGPELRMPHAITEALDALLGRMAHAHFRLQRSIEGYSRLAMVTRPAQQLQPRQWLCHRDRHASGTDSFVLASVLYLFRDAGLGGTAFYRPRRGAWETERLIHDSGVLDAGAFTARYGIQPGYPNGSNDWFEHTATIPARWNRLVVYEGSRFHCSDIPAPHRLSAKPTQGRLTLNGFFTCQKLPRD